MPTSARAGGEEPPISEDPRWSWFPDTFLKSITIGHASAIAELTRRETPPHAPTPGARTARTYQRFEVLPAIRCKRRKRQIGLVANRFVNPFFVPREMPAALFPHRLIFFLRLH